MSSLFGAETFKTMLDFIYSGFLDISGINGESVWNVLYAGLSLLLLLLRNW